MKQMKTVTVFEQEQYDGEWMPENLIQAIEWLQELLRSIPEQYRNDAQIEIDLTERYGCDRAQIKISYEREETDEEERIRIREEALAEQLSIKLEMSELARLQAKYGDRK